VGRVGLVLLERMGIWVAKGTGEVLSDLQQQSEQHPTQQIQEKLRV